MPTFSTFTLGCKVNQSETETIIQEISKYGFLWKPFTEVVDLYIINTCAVTSESSRKSRQIIRRAIRENSQALVAVTGCYAEISPEEILAIDGVDILQGQKDKHRLVEKIFKDPRFQNLDLKKCESCSSIKQRLHTRTFVKIQDGCNLYCAYCIVPLARGEPRSLPSEEILCFVERLLNSGTKEIVLTGVHLGKYGEDLRNGTNLVHLIKDIIEIDGKFRIRLSSLEPQEISHELIELIASSDKLCKHLNFPLQSGSDRILELMRRRYNREEYKSLVGEIRKKMPEIALTTDIMVGFPGEDDKDFNETVDLVKKIGFSKLHVFKFSPRPGTPASSYSPQVEEGEKKRRSRILIELGDELGKIYRQNFLGRIMEVMVEEEKEENIFCGVTDNYLRAYFKGNTKDLGEMKAIKLERLIQGGIWGLIA